MAPGLRSLTELYPALPARQQRRLVETAQSYLVDLDKAIQQVLAPSLARTGDEFMVSDEVIPLYGVGTTPQEAMADYRSVLVEYYESLEADKEELGEGLRKQLKVLHGVFDLAERGA